MDRCSNDHIPNLAWVDAMVAKDGKDLVKTLEIHKSEKKNRKWLEGTAKKKANDV